MKHSLITLAAVTAAFVLGCQDPGTTGPAATGDNAVPGAITKPQPIPDPTLIEFDQEVEYTNDDGSRPVMQAIGKINFHITQVPILRDELCDVEIAAKGKLYASTADGLAWSFGGSSKDRIRILNGTKVQFSKTFVVYGADVPSVLTMEFTATEKALALRTMSLNVKEKEPAVGLLNHQ